MDRKLELDVASGAAATHSPISTWTEAEASGQDLCAWRPGRLGDAIDRSSQYLLLHRGCALTTRSRGTCGEMRRRISALRRRHSAAPEASTALSRPNSERRIGRFFSQSALIHRGHWIFSSGSTSASRGAMHDLHPISPHFAGSTM